MEIWKRHICYCLVVIVICAISILLTDPKAVEHLAGIGLVAMFGLFMALVVVPIWRKEVEKRNKKP